MSTGAVVVSTPFEPARRSPTAWMGALCSAENALVSAALCAMLVLPLAESALRRLFQAYVARKQQDNVLDYDDLLLYWRHAMAEPAVAAEICRRFDHVLVDE